MGQKTIVLIELCFAYTAAKPGWHEADAATGGAGDLREGFRHCAAPRGHCS